MYYLISFLEGLITFLSPCLLPMLPVYVSYFAGGGQRSTAKTLTCASGFVLGFTLVFVAMGALAGTLGSFLIQYRTAVNLICGIIVILFGLNYLGVLKLRLFERMGRSTRTDNMNFLSAVVFGLVFSIGWTPCVGTFLGTALMMASQQGSAMIGMGMLLCYSLGLGVPFLISAVLIDQLKSGFKFIKSHYDVINRICGVMLVVVGVLMATGMLNGLLTRLR